MRVRSHLGILLLFTLVALALTYPAALKVADGTALPGLKDFDEFEYTWLLWWYKASLIDRQSVPANLPFYYPMETQLPLVDVTPIGWLLSIPLVLILAPVRAYIAYWLLNFVLCAYTAYVLAFRLTGNRWAAFVGGIVFGFYPGKMLHGLGHMGDMMIYMFPLYVLFLIKFFERPTFRRAGLLAVVTTIGLLIDFRHIGLFYFPFTAIYLLWQTVISPRSLISRDTVRYGLLAVALVLVLALPIFGPFLINSLRGQLSYLKEGGLQASSADLLSYVLPPMTHPLWRQVSWLKALMDRVWTESLYIETCLYLGVTTLLLGVVALARQRRARFWIAPILVGLVLALGPVLKVAGTEFDGIPLPYALLHRLPFYEWLRVPARMDMMIKLGLAMLAAEGLHNIMTCRSQIGRGTLTALTTSLILFEYLTFVPYPMADVTPCPFLERLSVDGDDYGILHVASHEYAMYLQTLHGHPMVEGHIHRWPPGGVEWGLQLHGLSLYPPESERAYWDIVDERLPYGRDGADIFAGRLDVAPASILSRLNIRYVVFDRKGPWTTDDKKLYRGRLRDYFGDAVYEDGRLTIHAVQANETDGPNLTPGAGWYSLEGGEYSRWRWMASDATIKVEGTEDRMYRLLLTTYGFELPRNLTITIDGERLEGYSIEAFQSIITPQFRAVDHEMDIIFSLAEGCDDQFDLFTGNLDDRCLGAAFSDVRLFPSLNEPHRFGEQIALLGYESARGVGDDQALYVSLYWQAIDRMTQDYSVFVHLLDENGRRIAQNDVLLSAGQGRTTSAWKSDQASRTLHRLELPSLAGLKNLGVQAGVYTVSTMERLPLLGDETGENVVILETGDRG